MAERPDRRVRRTQKLLSDALSELILEKDFKLITVNEITVRADVGLRTFYRHYANIDDLMLSIITSQFQEFEERMLPDLDIETFVKNGRLLFQYVEKNHRLFSVFFKTSQIDGLIPEMRQKAAAAIYDVVQKQTKNKNHTDAVINHVVTSIMSLIRWWLENDLPLSVEKMGKIYAEMIISSAKNYIESL